MSRSNILFGVGINDAGYSTQVSSIVDGRRRRIWICPYYQAWRDMLTRCYSSYFHARSPTYIGCTVSPEWLVFSSFKAWMRAQNWQGMALDKDILITGNKIYSADTCVFVSLALNNFLGSCARARGKYPIGVSWHKRRGDFRADCNNPFTGKAESLGHFSCQWRAHEAWRRRKHQHAIAYAALQDDPRIANALMIRYLSPLEMEK